jgi:hypothetical protein
MIINTFSISNQDLSRSIGTGLYLSAASLDHNCDPNCVVIFDGIEMSIEPLRSLLNKEKVNDSTKIY